MDPTCCPGAYYCPTSGDTECPRHCGFDTCCDQPGAHIPQDRAAWHRAQEALERQLLDQHARTQHLAAAA